MAIDSYRQASAQSEAIAPRVGGRIWRLAVIAAVALTCIAAFMLWQMRRVTLANEERALTMLSTALTDEIERGLAGVEVGLRTIRLELRNGNIPMTGESTQLALRYNTSLLPLVSRLWVVDTAGQLLAASNPVPAPPIAGFLPDLDTLSDETMAIGAPLPDMLARESMVPFAVRFVRSDGEPGGWLIAGIPGELLLGAFAVTRPVTGAALSVYRADGLLLTRSTPDVDASSQAGSASNPQLTMLSERRVAGADLQLQLSRGLADIYALWRQIAWLSMAGLMLIFATAVAALNRIQRGEQESAALERDLLARQVLNNRMESLGTLAGGIAHDFNNVLAAIIGYAEMARSAAANGSPQARHLDTVLQAAARGKSLVSRILTFSRDGSQLATVFELQPLVAEVLDLQTPSLPSSVVFERRLEMPEGRVRGDSTAVHEAIMNLLVNAALAMPDGGMITVSLQRALETEVRDLSHGRLGAGTWLGLSVADKGCGIAPEAFAHLFEPFFTTRGPSAGTGLGLAVVHGVVTALGGAIDVASEPGRGTTFTLYLPESHAPLDSVASDHIPLSDALVGSGETIMIVDDDPALVALNEEMLAGLGYEPVGFSSAACALETLRASPDRFDAVITDEMMPGMTGTELTVALRTFAPALPVLLISGYGGTQLDTRAARAGVTRVLAKPVQRAELAQALKFLLL